MILSGLEIKKYLGGRVGYKTIGMELLEAEMVQPD